MTRTILMCAAGAAAVMMAGCMSDGMGGGDMDGMAASSTASSSMANPTVGGAEMLSTRNIVENAVNSPIHTTLVAAVTQAQLAETLSGPGPFTVFAPENSAFERLPQAAVQSLMQDANRPALQGVLTYHVVPGRLTSADLMRQIQAGGGRATLTTVQGGTLTASMMGDRIGLTDARGGMSHVTIADVMQSNGVIHSVDAVLMPAA